jgi:penicillin amidase
MKVRTRYVALACAVLLLAPAGAIYGLLRASLPRLDGELKAPSLAAPAHVSRDHLGVPAIEAQSRVDLAYATGFVHGQDRFIQMDLSRRLAAGELSEIIGKVAIEQDKVTRVFRFREVAREALAQAAPEERLVAEAYTRGVNAALASLRSRPWEYWVFGSPPAPWRPEDSFLVAYAMWWDLQANGFRREILRQEINASLRGKECGSGWKCGLRFLYPARTFWDAPVSPPASGSAVVEVSAGVPGPEVLDVRGKGVSQLAPGTLWLPSAPAAGSNNWAVAGQYTSTGAALVANDMHLGQRVPTIWYHARLTIKGGSEPPLDLNGVTLPGTPLLVAGTNGHIAWGFTNSYGDWVDVTRVPCTAVGAAELQTPAGPIALSVAHEEIRVHGAPSVTLDVKTGPAGLLLTAQPQRGVCWFGRWLAQLPAATNFSLVNLERASSVAQALALAPTIGIPHQNFVVGDRDGHIGWAIAGRIPEDTGPERAAGHSPWSREAPHIMDPPAGRIWTANARVTSDARQELVIGGDKAVLGSEYDLAARAHQIRDDLLALTQPATPADMLRIQLDDRALFLTRWHDLLLKLIDEDAVRGQPQRADFKRLVDQWNARASTDSVGYRLVRTYRERTQRAVWEMLLQALDIPVDENALIPAAFEDPLWQLVNEQPLHMLAPSYRSWREFLLAQLDATITELKASCGELERCAWGFRRAVHVQHPLSRALTMLSSFLDMPSVELPGDHNMPRVQDGSFGASERFAISPGHEKEGYLHIPGGQSGHPLSPYYRAGFDAWATGEPLPLLPGSPEHELTLRP